MTDKMFSYFAGGAIIVFIALRVWAQPIFDNTSVSALYHATSFGLIVATFFLVMFLLLKGLSFFLKTIPGVIVIVLAALALFAAAYAKLSMDNKLDAQFGDKKTNYRRPDPK